MKIIITINDTKEAMGTFKEYENILENGVIGKESETIYREIHNQLTTHVSCSDSENECSGIIANDFVVEKHEHKMLHFDTLVETTTYNNGSETDQNWKSFKVELFVKLNGVTIPLTKLKSWTETMLMVIEDYTKNKKSPIDHIRNSKLHTPTVSVIEIHKHDQRVWREFWGKSTELSVGVIYLSGDPDNPNHCDTVTFMETPTGEKVIRFGGRLVEFCKVFPVK